MTRVANVGLWVTAGMLIATYLVGFGLSVASRLPRPIEFMYGEAIVLAVAGRVARGEPLYPTPDHLPLLVSAYTPLYYLLVGGLQPLVGGGYAAGRVVSLAATVGAASMLAWSVQRVSGRWLGGLLAAGLFLTQNMTVVVWAPLHRADALALFFSLAGLALATARRTWLAAAVLVLAVLTKQTHLSAPAAVFLALWPNWRAMVGFGSLFGGGLALALGIAQALSGGWFLWHTVHANVNPWSFDFFAAMLSWLLQVNAVPVLLATAVFSLPPRPGELHWRLYFLATVPILLTLGKFGSSSNYWLELNAASAALIGLLTDRLARRPNLHAGLARVVIGALLAVGLNFHAEVRAAASMLVRPGGPAAVGIPADVLAPIMAEPADVLTEPPALALAAGKPIMFEFLIFRLLADQGRWDERPILDAIAAQRFGLVVLSHSIDTPLEQTHWTASVRDALRASYEQVGFQDGYWFYRPMRSGTGPPPPTAPPRR